MFACNTLSRLDVNQNTSIFLTYRGLGSKLSLIFWMKKLVVVASTGNCYFFYVLFDQMCSGQRLCDLLNLWHRLCLTIVINIWHKSIFELWWDFVRPTWSLACEKNMFYMNAIIKLKKETRIEIQIDFQNKFYFYDSKHLRFMFKGAILLFVMGTPTLKKMNRLGAHSF